MVRHFVDTRVDGTYLGNPLYQTVVSVGPLVETRQSLEPLIFGNPRHIIENCLQQTFSNKLNTLYSYYFPKKLLL